MVEKKKRCFKCGKEKPLSEFYAHSRMKDGHLNKCKECTKRDVRKHRAENLDKIREYDRRRSKTESRLGMSSARCKVYRSENPAKYKAHSAVASALRRGKLSKGVCAICGSLKVEGHHEDYSKPLDVIWLCSEHHSLLHYHRQDALRLLEANIFLPTAAPL